MELIKYLYFVLFKRSKKTRPSEENDSTLKKINDGIAKLEVYENNAMADIEHKLKKILAEKGANIQEIEEKNPDMIEKIKLGAFARYIKEIHRLKSKLLYFKGRRELLRNLL